MPAFQFPSWLSYESPAQAMPPETLPPGNLQRSITQQIMDAVQQHACPSSSEFQRKKAAIKEAGLITYPNPFCF